jgi:hypothetical protein
MSHPLRLRGDPVRMVFKNFLPHHQLDIHLWTEFLCRIWREDYLFIVCVDNGRIRFCSTVAAFYEKALTDCLRRWC